MSDLYPPVRKGGPAASFDVAGDTPVRDPRPVADQRAAPSWEHCDHLYWNVDIPICRAMEVRRGKRAAARCYHSATARYAGCLRSTPGHALPPLDTRIQ